MSVTSTNVQSVLVVDDEGDIKDLMCLHLEREGFRVDAVEDGQEALELVNGEKVYDLVVLDWMLPGISGLEICKKVQRKIPILMVTARADSADIVQGLEGGVDD